MWDTVRTPRLWLASPFCLGVLLHGQGYLSLSPRPHTFPAQRLVWGRMQRGQLEEFLWSLAGRRGPIFFCPSSPLLSQAQGASLSIFLPHRSSGLGPGTPF